MTAADQAPKAIAGPKVLQGHDAGIVSRFAAAIVDFVVIVAAIAGIYVGIAGFAFILDPRNFSWPSGVAWSIPLIGAAIGAPYLAIAWCSSGRTIGDALFGLRVVSRNGERIRLPRAVVRAVFCLVFPVGLFWIPFSDSRRSVQDLVLRTSVIYDWASRRSLRQVPPRGRAS